MIVAVVLAGGRSRRFGSEKAMTLFNGELLIPQAVRRLSDQGLVVAINAPPASGAATWAAGHGRPLLTDDPASPSGPLAGVMAGLRWAASLGADLLATVPCDTPRLPSHLEQTLAADLGSDGAATARTPSGLQPLCTVWRVEPALVALSAHFDAGSHPAVHDFLAEIGGVAVEFPDEIDFVNLNTPQDRDEAETS